MSDVMISYSRKNGDFVHKLIDSLLAAQRDVWVDWEDIARGEDWWRSIQAGVDGADTALIIVTEYWLTSEICHRELDYIRQQNKRVFPIIREKIEGDIALRVKGTWVDTDWEQRARENWKYLRSVNWVYFDDDSAYDKSLQDLLTALDTDQAYVKNHTRYLVRAREWQQSHLNPSFLLEGDQVDAAVTWLEGSVGKHPEPLVAHKEYIGASRVADTALKAREKAREQLIRRFQRTAVALGVLVVVAIIAAVMVGQQFISARAEVTKAGATLQQVNLQVTDALNQQATAAVKVDAAEALVVTATLEQGRAIEAQKTSVVREQAASTQVAVAGATLSPVPPTLTAVAAAINDAYTQQDIAIQIVNASLRLSAHDVAGALQIADDMVSAYPNQAFAYLGRGLMLDSANQPDEAVAAYSKAIAIDPEYLDAYVNRGQQYKAQDKYDQAIADFTRAITIAPDEAQNYTYRGQTYDLQNKLDEALADYSRAINADPQNADAYGMRGSAYARNGQFQDALSDYWSWVNLSQTKVTTAIPVTQAQFPFHATIKMTYGYSYRIPFVGSAGQVVKAQADAAQDTAVDPLLMILDADGSPLTFNDDVTTDTLGAAITDFVLPADGRYTLLVGHAVASAEGDIDVTFDLMPTAALPTTTATP